MALAHEDLDESTPGPAAPAAALPKPNLSLVADPPPARPKRGSRRRRQGAAPPPATAATSAARDAAAPLAAPAAQAPPAAITPPAPPPAAALPAAPVDRRPLVRRRRVRADRDLGWLRSVAYAVAILAMVGAGLGAGYWAFAVLDHSPVFSIHAPPGTSGELRFTLRDGS